MIKKLREIVLDVETTGLYHNQGDRIIELGCVELINHIPSGKTLQKYFNPTTKYVSEEALKIHNIDNDFLKKQPTFESSHKEILNFLSKDTLIIHNASFDLGFLNKELKIIGVKELENPHVDTLLLARKKLGGGPMKLDSLCKRFNIDLSIRGFHGALLDANLLVEVYIELLGGKQSGFDFFKESKQAKNTKEAINKEKTSKKTKLIRASDEEIALHKKFVKSIKEPIWKKFNY